MNKINKIINITAPLVGLTSFIFAIMTYYGGEFKKHPTFGVIMFLSWLLLFTGSVLGILIWFLYKYINNKHPKPYETLYSHIQLIAVTREIIVYEVTELIQCKRVWLDNHDFKFKWSGDPKPKVSSKLQDTSLDKIKYSPNGSGDMDVANLHFKKAVVYNQVETIHVKIDATDLSLKAVPILGVKIESPQRAIHFVADLRYKTDDYTAFAWIERRKIGAESMLDWERINNTIEFKNKRYEHIFTDVEMGYHYRLHWEW